MTPAGEIAAQVGRNCLVSDARTWGYHSLCGLLMRMRELYKRERGLAPWARVETAAILPWVGELEATWARLEGAAYEPLVIDGVSFDPFDEEGIGARLAPRGLVYAAGAGPGGKPLFVLGEAAGRRVAAGHPVEVVGRELARDLTPTPAMFRPGRIVARLEPTLFALWAAIEDAGLKGGPSPAADALAAEGLDLAAVLRDPAAHAVRLGEIASRELDTAILHELGELAEEGRRGERWRAFLLRAAGTKAEILARALRDALADAGPGGTLEGLVAARARSSLGFFAAADPGLRRRALPEVRAAWEAVRSGAGWEAAETVRAAACLRLERLVPRLLGVFDGAAGAEETRRRIDAFEEEFLAARP